MDYPDVKSLRKFYGSRLGGIAQHYVKLALKETAEKLSGHNVIGVGYTTPYLEPFFGKNNSVIAVVPTEEGEVTWHYAAPRMVTAASELELPFADGAVDLVVLVHALEYAENPSQLMHEVWRVLAPSGQVVIMVPNRQGLWARADATPFGHGQPYSASQLAQLFEETSFTPLKQETLLFLPPTDRFISRPHRLMESLGKRLLPSFGGVLLASAQKQVYALSKQQKSSQSKKRVLVPALGTSMHSSPQ